ncbi:MAG: divalent-cation tolerance protein CutA [Chitinispirillaceae bacterium]|nr:divalent-cation tolerance protein CutA [Chitinispirillaceae bacterium]
MSAIWLYITTKDTTEAEAIGKKLIEEHLAACVNIFDKIKSIYRWEGKICEDNEAVLIVKSREDLLSKIVKRVKELHSYSCPCIIALPVIGGNEDFLNWIKKETSY